MKKIHIFCVIVLACMASCKTVHCPGFDMNDFSMISYRQGDTIRYVSDQNDELQLVVQSFSSSGPYDEHGGGEVFCDLDVYYQTDCVDGISIKEYYLTEYNYEATFGNDQTYGQGVGSDYEIAEESDTLYKGISCYKKTYRDLTGKRRISRFTKMEFRGIIEFYDKSTGLTWKLANK